MENTIIAREHLFTNKGLKTATNRIIKATEELLRTANEDGLILHVYRGI